MKYQQTAHVAGPDCTPEPATVRSQPAVSVPQRGKHRPTFRSLPPHVVFQQVTAPRPAGDVWRMAYDLVWAAAARAEARKAAVS